MIVAVAHAIVSSGRVTLEAIGAVGAANAVLYVVVQNLGVEPREPPPAPGATDVLAAVHNVARERVRKRSDSRAAAPGA